nr:MAG TPA: hypothetical protein [Caudoviricetes sp.]
MSAWYAVNGSSVITVGHAELWGSLTGGQKRYARS